MGFAIARPMGGGGGGGVSMGGGGMDGGMAGEVAAENFILAFFHKLPIWMQGVLMVALVVAAAWILGIILGKLYASVKYPDPEKQSVIHPIVKIGFGVAVICCGIWLYSSITKVPEKVTDVSNPDGIVTDENKPTPENPDGNPVTDEAETPSEAPTDSDSSSEASVEAPVNPSNKNTTIAMPLPAVNVAT